MACGGQADPLDSVYLRVHNTSDCDFVALEVGLVLPDLKFGPLAAGQTSEYVRGKSFGYYAVSSGLATSEDGVEFIAALIDLDGARPLAAGRYTYELRADSCTRDPLFGENRQQMILHIKSGGEY